MLDELHLGRERVSIGEVQLDVARARLIARDG
jgi:hypothetical protein